MVKVKGYSVQHEQDTRQELLYLIQYDTLLPKARDIITKCDGYFITKCNRSLLQNASGFFITKWDSFITKWNNYYEIQQFYYKMQQLLNNVSSDVQKLGRRKFRWIHNFDSFQFVLQCDQWIRDGLISFVHYLLVLERTFEWALSPPHICFCLLSI